MQRDAQSAMSACDYNIDYFCAAGACTASLRYSECNDKGECDAAATTFYHEEIITAQAGKVLNDECNFVDATWTALACDTNVDIVIGSCTIQQRYSECNGAGACDTNADTHFELGTVEHANAGRVFNAQGQQTNATAPSLACNGAVVPMCEAGSCTGTIRYAECNGTGDCDEEATTYYHEAAVVVQAGMVLTEACEEVAGYCGGIPGNTCNATGQCIATKSGY